MKIKSYSVLLIAIIGLLLGGNASADGIKSSAIQTQNIPAQIEQIRQRINRLTVQTQKKTIPAAPAKLSPEKINYIQAQLKVIAGKVERLKVEVGIFVTLRQIKEKTAALAKLIAPDSAKTAAAAAVKSVTPVVKVQIPAATSTVESVPAKTDKKAIEEQIAKVKQQIADLTQQLENKTSANESAAVGSEQCSGSNCKVASQTQSGSPSAPAVKNVPEQKKGFWQSVGDFFKRIFTF